MDGWFGCCFAVAFVFWVESERLRSHFQYLRRNMGVRVSLFFMLDIHPVTFYLYPLYKEGAPPDDGRPIASFHTQAAGLPLQNSSILLCLSLRK